MKRLPAVMLVLASLGAGAQQPPARTPADPNLPEAAPTHRAPAEEIDCDGVSRERSPGMSSEEHRRLMEVCAAADRDRAPEGTRRDEKPAPEPKPSR